MAKLYMSLQEATKLLGGIKPTKKAKPCTIDGVACLVWASHGKAVFDVSAIHEHSIYIGKNPAITTEVYDSQTLKMRSEDAVSIVRTDYEGGKQK